MKILVINCGSSTLKFELINAEGEDDFQGKGSVIARGIVEKIGGRGAIEFIVEQGESFRERAEVPDHGEATKRVINWLNSSGVLQSDGLGAVGHRLVHGGYRFWEPTVINDNVIDALEEVSSLAPLHNRPSLSAIRGARRELDPAVPMVAVFDTAFHSTLPDHASKYAIPEDLAKKHHVRRYGFHGIAHQYMTERYAAITSKPVEQVNLVTLQLGNGCSAAAVENGRSVDTSMGFTPLEGLMMGTRSGDVDPSLAGYLARCEGVDIQEAERLLNKRSGLLGVSGLSQDMRELLKAEEEGDASAALAVTMFCYRIKKYIGAYLAVIRRADAVVFGGGIGENAPQVRARICSGMDWCGLVLDQERNVETVGIEMRISADASKIDIHVIPVDEARIIARDTIRCLRSQDEQVPH
jgi:acetate kinase